MTLNPSVFSLTQGLRVKPKFIVMTAMLLMACQETPEEQARRELAVAEEKRRIQKELHDANLNAVAHDCAREQAADHLDSHLGLFKLEPDFMVSVENVFW